jgi:hypothetical protein
MEGERATYVEIQAVQPRVGRSPRARLQWALDFVHRDLDGTTDKEWALLQREYLAFSHIVIAPDSMNSAWVRKLLAGEPWTAAWIRQGEARRPGRPLGGSRQGSLGTFVRLGSPSPVRLPSRDHLRRHQAEWSHIISEIVSDRALVEIGPFTVRVRLTRRVRDSHLEPIADNPDEAGRLALSNLLGAFSHLVARCRDDTCKKQFVGNRRGQTFCSRACQNRAAIRRYRQRRAKTGRRRYRGRDR